MATVNGAVSKIGRLSTAILERIAELDAESLSPATARRLLEIRFDKSVQKRVEALAKKSQAGTLSPDERAEYDEIIHVADVLAILQSKARLALKKASAAR
jgi:hypothetical protein